VFFNVSELPSPGKHEFDGPQGCIPPEEKP
jgi:hypothetical protein